MRLESFINSQNWTGRQPVIVAGLVTLVFTLVARWLRGVTFSGAVAGAVVCFAIYISAGPRAVAILALVFALTWVSTRFGESRKNSRGTAEDRQGRTASQVLANLAVSAVCAVASFATGHTVFLLGTVAALAEATGDTVSSELGRAHSELARLITTWKTVKSGTSGGVSGIGTVSGVAAALLIGVAAVGVGLLPGEWLGISAVAATVGMIADSVLGATLESKGLLNNNWVNLIGTLISAMVAMAMA